MEDNFLERPEPKPINTMERLVYIPILILPCTLVFAFGEADVVIDHPQLERKQGLLYYDGSLFSGYTFETYAEGVLKSRTRWVNGKRQGKSTKWYENGIIKEVRSYENNRKNGKHLGYYPDGTKRFEYHFLDSQYHGCYREWYPDGSPSALRFYKFGVEDGLQKMFEADGSIRANYVVKDGYRYGLVGSRNCITTPTTVTP